MLPRRWIVNGPICVAQSLPTARKGLGKPKSQGARISAPRINPPSCSENSAIPFDVPGQTLSGSAMAPFPHPAHRTGQADLPHPALGQELTLSRATPSVVSDQLSELIGFPISKVLPTYCACLELRSLPSTGVTRLPRYYEPLRHPKAPSLSLAGFRLVIADHAMGLPVLRALSLCTCCRHYPGAAAGRTLCSAHPAVSAFPERVVGSACALSFSRIAQRSLALRPAHSRCHQFVTR